MNFGVSSSFSAAVSAVSVGPTARVNYSTKDDQVPEMDYSDDNVADDANDSEPILADNTAYKGSYAGLSKIASTLTNGLLANKGGFGGVIGYTFEAVIVFAGMLIGGKSLGESAWKLTTTVGKQVSKNLFTNVVHMKDITKRFTQSVSIGTALGNYALPANASFGSKFAVVWQGLSGDVFAQFGAQFGINIGFNVVWDLIDGGDFKLGTDIYKGGVMCVFGTAGKFFGAFFGGKITEAAFNAAGAWVAEVTVKWYDTEVARGCAGVALVVGGAIGLIAAVAAGWCVLAVGACILVGAAIGAAIVWVAEKIVQAWPAITAWATETWNSFIDWGEQAWEDTKAVVVETWDAACDWAENAWEETTEFVSESWDAACDWAEDAWNDVQDFGEAAWEFVTSW